MIKINKIIVIAILVLIKLKMVTSNKYCSLQSVTGQSRYFMCGRHEYCCTFGCCVHLAFQFYQLWYYWLLLIFMFMVCSGGSWWYRFCRQNDSSGSIRSQLPGSDTGSYYGVNHHLLHSTPTRSSSTLNGSRHPTSTANDYDRRVTLVRNNGVHSYYYRNGRNASHYDTASVRYHNGAAGNDRTLRRYQQQPSAHPHQNNFLPRLELCPYYQLYGPPPSYESVVQLSSDNSTTSCALAEPLTTIAPTTTDESCVGAALVTPTPSISTSPRIIQPIVTVNLSNALSTSIEVRPICSSSGNLPLSNDSQSASTMNTNTNHIEVIQQQQLQHQIDNTTNEIINDNKIIDTSPNNLKILNSIKTTIEPTTTNIQEELIRSDNKSNDQKHIIPESCNISNCSTITASSTTTTTTTIVPLSFRTNFLMRNEKNSIPSVCSSNSTLTTVPNKYCSSEQQHQQQSMLLHQHQQQQHQQPQPTTSIILKDFDNTQCTCSIGSSTIMSTISTSQASHTNNSKSIIELNKSKFLKSSKFNRKYYKKNSNNGSGSSNNDNSNHQSNSNNLSNNGSNCNNLNASNSNNSRNGINYNRQASSGELLNPILPSSPLNILSSLDRSVLDNLVSNPNDMMQTISSTTTASTETISTNLPVKVAIAKINSKKH